MIEPLPAFVLPAKGDGMENFMKKISPILLRCLSYILLICIAFTLFTYKGDSVETPIIAMPLVSGLKASAKTPVKKDYGVFLGLDASGLEKIARYKTVVIDAQYFTKKDIMYLKKQGCTVYSYLNVGSVEKFRRYYDKYSKLAIGDYEHWENERWMDVSKTEWQKFLESLERKLIKKGIDGFFVDNCDVYYNYPKKKIFKGLTKVLKHLMTFDKPVIINGADVYVMKYKSHHGKLSDIMTGVNQESVWSKINFDTGSFSKQKTKERKYFQKYIETCDREGITVYLLEYTQNRKLKNKIKKYCQKQHFYYYISDSIELD